MTGQSWNPKTRDGEWGQGDRGLGDMGREYEGRFEGGVYVTACYLASRTAYCPFGICSQLTEYALSNSKALF